MSTHVAKAMKPIFSLKTGFGLVIKKPKRKQIAAVLKVLPAVDKDSDYLILNKNGKAFRGISQTYMQTRPQRKPEYEEMFLVEHRDGVAGRHYCGYIEAGAPVAALFISYRRDDDAWREMLVWRDISFKFDDLRAALPPEELAASYFPEGEWEKGLELKEQRDGAFWEDWNENLPS